MTDKSELAARFDRVLVALETVIATESDYEEIKNDVIATSPVDALLLRDQARVAFKEETPTMDTLVINLKDNHYKDPLWPPDGADDARMLRTVWHFIDDTIRAGNSFAPDDLSVMRNLHAALERARDNLTVPHAPSAGDNDALKPSWNRIKGELSFDGGVIRTIRGIGVAKNVVSVLDAFQEEGWPERVDSPLSSPHSQKHHATITSLNTGLSRIRFRSDGEGQGFIWEAL